MATYKLASLQPSTSKPLAELGLPDNLVKYLHELGIDDCDRLLGTLVAAPEAWEKDLQALGVPYDGLIAVLKKELPETMIEACSSKRSYRTGLIPD